LSFFFILNVWHAQSKCKALKNQMHIIVLNVTEYDLGQVCWMVCLK